MTMRQFASRSAALALLAGVVALVYALVVEPIQRRIVTAVERIGTERDLIARLERGLAEAAPNEPSGRESAPDRAVFLAGESDAVMAARLEAVLRAATKGLADVRTTSTRTLTPRDHQGLRLIGLEARMTAPLASLQGLLLTLERTTPLVLIETLQVSAAASSGGAVAAEGEQPLDIRIEVYGAARSGGANGNVPALEASLASPAEAPSEPKPLGGGNGSRR